MIDSLGNLLTVVLVLMGVSVLIALAGLVLIARRVRRLRIPPDADYFTTMRYIPLALAILLDLLDFGLDIFSAPISWIMLDRMGLYNLRNKAAVEALIPFTQPIPTFTLSWFAARFLNLGDQPWPARRERLEYLDERRAPRRRRPTIIDMDDPRR
jgi:hypothetical protein